MLLPSHSMTIADALSNATQQINRLDAEVLLAHALQCSRSRLYHSPEQPLSIEEWQQFAGLIKRRSMHEPVAYLTGKKEFWSIEFSVNEKTLIPRPETELLVEVILQRYPVHAGKLKIADIGTGSGVIAIALAKERPAWQIYATDICAAALQVAQENAKNNAVSSIIFAEGDLLTALPQEQFDLIVSNPPYLSQLEYTANETSLQYEPKSALVSADNGFATLQAIILQAKRWLKPAGALYLEHGFLQGPLLQDILLAAEYVEVQTLKDYANLDRITVGHL